MSESISVLILDDDELVRESVSAFLEDEGFRVATVSTAEGALAMLQSGSYDLCITDFTLPGMDGEKLIILAHEICPETRFIMHSGFNFIPSEEMSKTGFTIENVMPKPIIRLELLSEKIRSLAGKHGASE
jgi:CheY-like chemotaxis protein